MKIGDRCFVHGYVDEIRKDTVIIRNKGGYFGKSAEKMCFYKKTLYAKQSEIQQQSYGGKV